MTVESMQIELPASREPQAQGPWSDLALHTIGWRAFQDLCSQVCEVVLGRPVEIFREAQDGGQDAVFLIPAKPTLYRSGRSSANIHLTHQRR